MTIIISGCMGILLLVTTMSGAPLTTTLIAPSEAVPGAALNVEGVTLNLGSDEEQFERAQVVRGTLVIGAKSWPVEFRSAEPGQHAIAKGGFILTNYVLNLPPEAVGMGVIEVFSPEIRPGRLALKIVARPESPETNAVNRSQANAAAGTQGAVAIDVDSTVLGRTFAGRLAAHEPIYFAYGVGRDRTKFQFSFKYKLADFSSDSAVTLRNTLQFGYTQRSLWDLDANSSPFFDTSYIPELFWEWYRLPTNNPRRNLSWNGFQLGVLHESNGRDGVDSRSLNVAKFGTVFFIGPLDGRHLTLAPEVIVYLGDSDKARAIEEYRGNVRLRAAYGRSDGLQFALTGMAGDSFSKHGSVQIDVSSPVHIPVLDLSLFALVQYFNGYAESLRAFDRKSESVRAGFSLVR